MRNQNGQSLIEILLASALLIILLPAIFSGLISTREGRAQQEQRVNASILLRDTEESLRIVRERGWSVFANNGTFHPVRDLNTWTLSSGIEIDGGITREVIISDVYRDDNGIISPTGNLDLSTKHITTTVSWETPFPSSITSESYFTRYLDNLAFTETSYEDFLLGTQDGTVVMNSNGGEIILGAGGNGSWCLPNNISATELDLPKQGVANTISSIEGQLIAGTGENASGVSLAKVTISNDSPPVAQIDGELYGYKTNDVFTESDYAYLVTDNNQKEVVIVDISSNPFVETGYVDLSGPQDADGIFVINNLGLAIQGNVLWSFDLSQKSGSRPLFDPDGLNLAGTSKEMVVIGSYAYIAIDGDPELQIVDLNDPNNLTIVAWADVPGNGGRDIVVNSSGSRGYLATANSSTENEMFVIDTSNKSGNLPVLGSYDTQDMDPQAIIAVPGNIIIVGGIGGQEYQVVNIINETNPTSCGGTDIDTGINDLDAILELDGDAYSYVLTGDSNNELKIIEGGPGGQFSTEAIYESSIFDPGSSVVFNRLDVVETILSGTTLKYQVAIADTVASSCDGADFVYIGPDKTSDTYFGETFSIPFDNDEIGYENPGQCFRYKVFFSTENIESSPAFEEIRVNYSP